MLIAAGADVNARDEYGVTPLHAAAANGNAEVARVLLENGANPNLREQWGMTALERSKSWRETRAPDDQKYFDEVEAVLYAGRTANDRRMTGLLAGLMTKSRRYATDGDGNSALHLAAALENVPVVRSLLKAGAPANARNREKRMPLHEAAANPRSLLLGNIKGLLTNGADVNARDAFNSTPLHEAVKALPSDATVAAVRLLLAERADPNVKDISDRKPLDIAKRERQYYAKYYRGPDKGEIDKTLAQIIALLENVTVSAPIRRIFGKTRIADDYLVSAVVYLNDGVEPFVQLGNPRNDGTGTFEFHLDEGRKFQLFAYYVGNVDGKVTSLSARTEIMTVKGDVGPIILTLNPAAGK